MSVKRKIGASFVGIVVLFGLIVFTLVNCLMTRALQAQLDQRALAIATNLSHAVAGRDPADLDPLVARYARLDGVAYSFIRDTNGEVVSHSLGTFPPELREYERDPRRMARRETQLRGEIVRETRVPILGGEVGAVHVGVWSGAARKEIREALYPLVGTIAALVLLATLASLLLAHSIVHPILKLTRIAENMSKGDLETVIGIETQNEIGALAHSLERMRASLKAAMVRLEHEYDTGRQTPSKAPVEEPSIKSPKAEGVEHEQSV